MVSKFIFILDFLFLVSSSVTSFVVINHFIHKNKSSSPKYQDPEKIVIEELPTPENLRKYIMVDRVVYKKDKFRKKWAIISKKHLSEIIKNLEAWNKNALKKETLEDRKKYKLKTQKRWNNDLLDEGYV